jgi:acetyltransferase-like isoleucine patch superfamily enzyme
VINRFGGKYIISLCGTIYIYLSIHKFFTYSFTDGLEVIWMPKKLGTIDYDRSFSGLIHDGIKRYMNWFVRSVPMTPEMRVKLQRLRGMKIGKNVFIGINVFFDDARPDLITIDDNVTILVGTTILAHVYPPDHFRNIIKEKEQGVVLKEYCYIGANSLILPGVIIGEYSIIGAGSVVTKSIPSYSLAYGVPAKVIRSYSKDDII